MTLIYALNGLDLHDPDNGLRVLDAPVYSSNISMRNIATTLPGMHGQVPVWNSPMDASTIAIKMRISDRDDDELQAKWDRVMRALGIGRNQATILSRTRGTRVTSTEAQLASMDPPDFSCAGGFVTPTLTFNIPSGRWYGASVDEVLSLSGANQDVDVVDDSSMPITGAKFLAKGPISGLHVYDNTSQTGFDFAGTNITSAQWLLIDLTTFTAWQKSSATWDDSGTNVTAGLANSGIGWLSMVPGLNADDPSSVSVTSSGTSGDSTLTLRAQPAYL